MPGLRFGMPTLIDLGGIENQIDFCADLGLRFVEINTDLPDFTPGRTDPDRVRAFGERRAIGFTVHLPETLDLASFHESMRKGDLVACIEALEWSGRAGATLVNMHLNDGVYFTLPGGRVFVYERHEEEFQSRFLQSLETLSGVARRLELTLCIENAGAWDRPFVQRALAAAAKSADIGLTWDTGHDGASGHAHKPFLMAHADHVRHLHLHDFRGSRNHLPLFTGELDVDEAITFARERGLGVVIEVKAPAELELSVRALRERYHE